MVSLATIVYILHCKLMESKSNNKPKSLQSWKDILYLICSLWRDWAWVLRTLEGW